MARVPLRLFLHEGCDPLDHRTSQNPGTGRYNSDATYFWGRPQSDPESNAKRGFTHLSGMFRRSASLAIPHLKSFAAIPSVSLVQLGHTNRNVFLSHESQREIDPRLGTFKTNSLLPTRRKWGRKMGLCFAMFVFLTFRGPLASHDSNPYPNRSRIARYNATKLTMGNEMITKLNQKGPNSAL